MSVDDGPRLTGVSGGKIQFVPESRADAGRFSHGVQQRERLIRQVIRARRTVDAGQRSQSTATGDPAKVALVERAKQWVQGDPPHGAVPGAS